MDDEEKQRRLEKPLSLTPNNELAEYFHDWQSSAAGRTFCYRSSTLEPVLMDFVEYVRWRIKGTDRPIHFPPEHKREGGWHTAHIVIPEDMETSWEAAHHFIRSIQRIRKTRFSFEVVGTHSEISLQFACSSNDDLKLLISHLEAVYPKLEIKYDQADRLVYWGLPEDSYRHVMEFGLKEDFVFPLQVLSKSKLDPWAGIMSALSRLNGGEVGIVQIIFKPVVQRWREEITSLSGLIPFYFSQSESGQKRIGDLIQEKISQPFFSVRLRIAAQAKTDARVLAILDSLTAPLSILHRQGSNQLIELGVSDFYNRKNAESPLDQLEPRHTWITGMLLNSEELASLLRIPPPTARTDKLVQVEAPERSKAAPSSAIIASVADPTPEEINSAFKKASEKGILLGVNQHDGKTNFVALRNDQRIKHTYIIGASGSGKSTLLLNCIIQDMGRGDGIAVLDPHGDLVEDVLAWVPEHRLDDVILFDPSNQEYPVGLNVLSAKSETERNLLASDLMATFQRLSTSWGDQMTAVFGNAIHAILESNVGGTLVDLRRFLIEPDFREAFLETVQDSQIVYYWKKEFPLLTGQKSVGPLVTRLNTFLRPKVVRYVVGQKESKVDFGTVLNKRKIFLAKLPQGLIGEDDSRLLGTLIVSMIHQHAIARQAVAEQERPDFFLYIDEFHHFVTPSMSSILTGARKYHLGLVLAHQEFQQLKSRSPDVASSILANPFTRICFRLGDEDAPKFSDGFSFFEEDDLKALGVGQAICRFETVQNDFNLTAFRLTQDKDVADQRRQRVRALSQAKYATERSIVEAELAENVATDTPKPEARAVPTTRHKSTPAIPVSKKDQDGEEADPLENVFVDPIVKETKRPVIRKPTSSAKSEPPARDDKDHERMKNIIKEYANASRYFAQTEYPLKDGKRVDVHMQKDGQPLMACEISCTNKPEYEIGNLEKCLRAGYEIVIQVAFEEKTLKPIKKLAESHFAPDQLKQIKFMTLAECLAYLQELGAQQAATKKTIFGREVETKYKVPTEEEWQRKINSLNSVLSGLFKRMGQKERE